MPLTMGLPKIPKIQKTDATASDHTPWNADTKRKIPFDNGLPSKPPAADEPVEIEIKRESEAIIKPSESNEEPLEIPKVVYSIF